MTNKISGFIESELRVVTAARYFYTPREQFRPAEEEYDEAGDCMLALLMVQADHEVQRAGSI